MMNGLLKTPQAFLMFLKEFVTKWDEKNKMCFVIKDNALVCYHSHITQYHKVTSTCSTHEPQNSSVARKGLITNHSEIPSHSNITMTRNCIIYSFLFPPLM